MPAQPARHIIPQVNQGMSLKVNVSALIADLRSSLDLTRRLVMKGRELLNGFDVWSHDDLTIVERMVIRGAREIRLRELRRLIDEVKDLSQDFHDKAAPAARVLQAFGEPVPTPLTTLDDVVIDTNTSISNHDWPGHIQDVITDLVDHLQDIDRLRNDYWSALERISNRA